MVFYKSWIYVSIFVPWETDRRKNILWPFSISHFPAVWKKTLPVAHHLRSSECGKPCP